MILASGFPNPVDWAIDKVQGFVGGAATQGFQMVVGGLTAWVLDAVVWIVGGVFHFFLDATDPNVQADWFAGRSGPYATTAAIGATLLVGFVLAGIAQGVLAGDAGGMLRQVGLHLPVSVLGIVGLVSVTQALVALTDALSRGVLERFEADVDSFTQAVKSVGALSGGTATAFVVFLLALVSVVAGLVLVAELVVRSALVYVVVALAPLVFAAQLWPALRGVGRKLLELLVALVVSKLVIAVALTVGAAAVAGTGSGGAVTAIPAPEVAAEDPGGSVTQAVGILLAAVAAFGVAAFSPLAVVRLMPLTEAALVAHGIRSGPVRAGHSAMAMGYHARSMSGHRLRSLAGGTPTAAAGAGSGSTMGAAAAGAGPVGAAAAGAASAATRAVGRASDAAERATAPPPSSGPRPTARPAARKEERRGQ